MRLCSGIYNLIFGKPEPKPEFKPYTDNTNTQNPPGTGNTNNNRNATTLPEQLAGNKQPNAAEKPTEHYPDEPVFTEYKIQKGQTISGILADYNKKHGTKIPIAELLAVNPGLDPNKVRAGQKIIIPHAEPEPMTFNAPESAKPVEPAAQKPNGAPVTNTIKAQKQTKSEAEMERLSLNLAAEHAKLEEGFRDSVYMDLGYPAIGYGHRIKPGEKFKKITKEQAANILKKDMKAAYNAIKEALGDSISNLNQCQRAALTNLAYNAGINAVKNSKCLQLIKEGKYDEAQAEMDYVKAKVMTKAAKGKKSVPKKDKDGNYVREVKLGLLKRRTREMIMFGNGELSKPAQEKLLGLFNETYKTNYKSIAEASQGLQKELARLELKYQNKTITDSELKKLTQLRNTKDILTTLDNPKGFLAQLNGQFGSAIAQR